MDRPEKVRHSSDEAACQNCGCRQVEHDPKRGENSCPNCGLVHDGAMLADDGVELRRGETPQNTPGNGLGTTIRGGDKTSRRLIMTQGRTVSKRKDFMDLLFDVVDSSGEGTRTSEDTKKLLSDANRDLKLSSKRNKLNGAKGMSSGDSSDYRRKVLAAAAFHVINDEGRENMAPQIADRWGVVLTDLAGAVRLLRRWREAELRKHDGYLPEDPYARRVRELNYWLSRLRDFLASNEEVTFGQASEVMLDARDFLRDHGEPLEHGDEWMMGGMLNVVAKRAAMEAMVHSMAHSGMSVLQARWLGRKVPLPGMTNFIDRCGQRVFSVGEEE